MLTSARAAIGLFCISALLACAGEETPDMGAPPDAGVSTDQGTTVVDLGTADTGTPDGGDTTDGGTPDAGQSAPFEFRVADIRNGGGLAAQMCLPERSDPMCQTPGVDVYAQWDIEVGERFYATAEAPEFFTSVYPFDRMRPGGIREDGLLVHRATTEAQALAVSATIAPGMGHVAIIMVGDNRAGAQFSAPAPSAIVRYVAENGDGFDGGLTGTSTATPVGVVLNLPPGTHPINVVHDSGRCAIVNQNGWRNGDDIEAVVLADSVTWLTMECGVPVCDWVEQDCANPGDKCRVILNGDGSFDTACVPAGDKDLLDNCTRPNGQPGEDDCGAGLYCSYFGLARSTPQQRHCLRTCDVDSLCEPGFSCLKFDTNLDRLGACVPACDPFGDDCVEGTHCTMFGNSGSAFPGLFTCSFDGTSTEGEACQGNSENCAAPYGCFQVNNFNDPVCREYCDDNTPCSDPQATCSQIMINGVRDYGVCL